MTAPGSKYKCLREYDMRRLIKVGTIIFFCNSILMSANGAHPEPMEIIEKLEQASAWANKVSMEISSETIVSGNGVREVNAGYKKQQTSYYRNDSSLYIKQIDTYLGKSIDDSSDIDSYKTLIILNIANETEGFVTAVRAESRERLAGMMYRDGSKDHLKSEDWDPRLGVFLEGKAYDLENTRRIDTLTEALRLNPILLDNMETIDGCECFVIQSETQNQRVTAWISPELGYNTLKYVSEPISYTFHGDQKFKYHTVVDNVKIQKINNHYIPVSGKLTKRYLESDGLVTTNIVNVKREQIDHNPDFSVIDNFSFKSNLPDGSLIRLAGIEGIRYIWQGGKLVSIVDEFVIQEMDKVASEIMSNEIVSSGRETDNNTKAGNQQNDQTVKLQQQEPQQQEIALVSDTSTIWQVILISVPIALVIIFFVLYRFKAKS